MSKSGTAFEVAIGVTAVAALLTCLSNAAEAVPVPSLYSYADAFGEAFVGNASTAFAHQHNTDNGTSSAGTSAGIDSSYTQSVYDPGLPGYTQVTWGVKADGSGTASASYGALHAQSTADFQLTPGSVTFEGYTSGGYPYSNTYVSPLMPEGSGSASASFADGFTLYAVGAGPGTTTVSVKFTMTLEAGIVGYSVPGSLFGGSKASADFYLATTNSFSYTDNILSTYVDSTTPASQTVSIIEQLTLGQDYYIQDALDTSAQVPTSDCTAPTCNGESFIANASNTQLLNIDILTSGVSLSSYSGHDYTSVATPEPASIAVLGVGLFGAGFMRRRRRG